LTEINPILARAYTFFKGVLAATLSLKLVRRKRIIQVSVAKAINLRTLVAELKAGANPCSSNRVNISLLTKDIDLKLSKSC
jgi:hypothetical protein